MNGMLPKPVVLGNVRWRRLVVAGGAVAVGVLAVAYPLAGAMLALLFFATSFIAYRRP